MDINYLAIFLAVIASQVIGFLWYSPKLFGDAWIKLNGWKKSEIEKAQKQGMLKNILVYFVALLVMGYVFSHFAGGWYENSDMSGVSVGLQTAFWIWLGFQATNMLGSVLWDRKPFKLYLINTSHQLVQLLAMGAIIGYWL